MASEFQILRDEGRLADHMQDEGIAGITVRAWHSSFDYALGLAKAVGEARGRAEGFEFGVQDARQNLDYLSPEPLLDHYSRAFEEDYQADFQAVADISFESGREEGGMVGFFEGTRVGYRVGYRKGLRQGYHDGFSDVESRPKE